MQSVNKVAGAHKSKEEAESIVVKSKAVEETTKVETPTCNYYGNFEDQFGIRQYFLCCIAFIIRDLSPHIYIFFAIFFHKPESISRSSSFIEAL